MKIDKLLRFESDNYFESISVNDFYSFTKSDFSHNILVDLSYEKASKDAELSEKFIKKLNNSREVYKYTFEENILIDAIIEFCNYIIMNKKYYWNKFTITHNTSPLPYILNGLKVYPSGNETDDENYLDLISQLPGTLRDIREKLIIQKEQGIMMHEDECHITIKMLKGFYQDNNSLLRRKLNSKKIDCIIDKFNEELNRTIEYLQNNYFEKGIIWKGVCELDNGREYYKSLINVYTSYNLSAEQIHEIGLENMRITRDKLRNIIEKTGHNMSIEEFNILLKKDLRFFDTSSDQLSGRMNGYINKIRPKLKDFFYKIPSTECDIRPIDKNRESSTTWGYYAIPVGNEEKGIYYFSGAELDKRCQLRTGAIVCHELLPGHHFQMNLIAEDKSLPKICNQHFNTAYADGWAEYAVDLSNEIGIFDEFDMYGRYLWDLILCVRLVVDTGINALGWSLDRVKQFMKENTDLTDAEIHTEALRYAVDMPGQALSYKFGSIKMHHFRNKSENALKDKFNIKDFHEAVLKYGSIPLNILEKSVDNYITQTINLL